MSLILFFFFNDTATTEIYTLSLHDALPIWMRDKTGQWRVLESTASAVRNKNGEVEKLIIVNRDVSERRLLEKQFLDRKSTRLNSSHANISYAVFCLKKKKKNCNSYKSTV